MKMLYRKLNVVAYDMCRALESMMSCNVTPTSDARIDRGGVDERRVGEWKRSELLMRKLGRRTSRMLRVESCASPPPTESTTIKTIQYNNINNKLQQNRRL